MSLFSPSGNSLGSNFDPDSTDKKQALPPLPPDDSFANLRYDFSKIFHDNNLDAFTNASDIGIPELSRMPSRTFGATTDNQLGLPEFDNVSRTEEKVEAYSRNNPVQHMNSSPIRLSQGEFNYANFGSQTSGIFHSGFNLKELFSPNSLGYMPNPFDTADKTHAKKDLFSQEFIDTYSNDPLTMMWNDDTSKPLKNVTNQPVNTDSQNMSFGCGGIGFQPYGNNSQESNRGFIDHLRMELSSATKLHQDLSAPIKRSSSKSEEKVEPPKPLKLLLDNKTSELVGKKTEVKKTKKDVTPNKRRGQVLEEDMDDTNDDKKARSYKGLRVLSSKVQDIVLEKRKTTYKEVAETLVKRLEKQTHEKLQKDSKDEQNVKRRVYDALNVLVASDILTKDGKIVSYNEAYFPTAKIQNNQLNKRKCEQLDSHIASTKKRKQEKMDVLKELLSKTVAIKNLIERNKSLAQEEAILQHHVHPNNSQSKGNDNNINATRVGVAAEEATYREGNNDIIKFPFIVMVSSKEDNALNLNMDVSQKRFLVESKEPLKLFGDIDILLKMGLHRISSTFFDRHLPKNLQKYMGYPLLQTPK